MTKSRFKVCFISAPQRADTGFLRAALDERGIRWTDMATLPPGASILDTVERGIAKADFVCGVIQANFDCASVFFETGIALGKGRPLLMFVAPGFEVPPYFRNLTYAPVNIRDPEAISLQLDAFLKHARFGEPSKARKFPVKTTHVKNAWAEETLSRLKAVPTPTSEIALEGFVSDLFRQSGAIVSKRAPSSGSHGADMAVWIDQLESTIGNPLLVEVKRGQLTEPDLYQAEVQLRSYLARGFGQAGLLVYEKSAKEEQTSSSSGWPLIVRLSVAELISLLGSGKFAQRMLEQRNKVAHGSS